MAKVQELFEMYKDTDGEKLFANLVYFLKAIMPVPLSREAALRDLSSMSQVPRCPPNMRDLS